MLGIFEGRDGASYSHEIPLRIDNRGHILPFDILVYYYGVDEGREGRLFISSMSFTICVHQQ